MLKTIHLSLSLEIQKKGIMNNPIVYKGVKRHDGQKRIINEIFANDSFHNVIVTPRQWGKSVMALNLVLYYALNNRNCKTLWASPIHAQAKYAMTTLYDAIKKGGVVTDYNKSERTIRLLNNSVINFTGTDNYENIRGISVNYLFIDECAYCNKDGIEKALIPTLATAGKKAFYISTPRGKYNFFYDVHLLGQQKTAGYTTYRGFLEENPHRNIELIESERLTKPSHIYRQEYLAEFLDSENSLFKNLNESARLNFAPPISGERYYAGIDLGRQNDYTVLTILNSKKEVVYIYRDRQKDWGTMRNIIENKLKEYNNADVYVEVNNVGDIFFEMLRNTYPKASAWQTTSSSKQNLIESLIVDFESGNIAIPTKEVFEPLFTELEAFNFEYSPTSRTVKYSAPSGVHDDTVISLGLANAMHTKNNKQGKLYIV